ncbi:hypothetical protein D9Q98_007417 [Chlorella vulgaris]|uniref:Uncharacterized protein n=1 Tax=Chlorella vulgaris TaxID=3077 RepID=A0A9D4YVR4_CHLVU|nr:hypothetical protein D9Q98_007417 [Chlorella vulgaris]
MRSTASYGLVSAGTTAWSLDQGTAADGPDARYVRLLVLAYLASLNKSLFAAKCLVEVVTDMYRRGVTLEDVKLMLSLASLQNGGQMLTALDEDVLTNYCAVIMLALEAVGVPLAPEGEERMRQLGRRNPADDQTGVIAGLRGMVRVAVDQFLSGTTLFRLQLMQSMQANVEGEAGGASPAIRMLQQNTRLVIIALEVVRGMGLPTEVPLHQPPGEGSDEEQQRQQQQQEQELDAQLAQRHWVPGFLAAGGDAGVEDGSTEAQQRAAAVRLLISFMGAAQGFLFPAWDFAQQAIQCYSNGWIADDVYKQLQDEEFAQTGGMALQVARLPGTSNVTAAVFARWLSLVYMTLVQLGAVFSGAAQRDGWAWVSGTGRSPAADAGQEGEEEAAAQPEGTASLEAYGLADFVLNTIRNEEQKELLSGGGVGLAEAAAVEGVLAPPPAGRQQDQQGFVSLEDPSLLETSPAMLVMGQQISLVQMTRQLVLQGQTQEATTA